MTFEARGTRLAAGKVKCECQQQRVKHGHAAGGKITPTYESWKDMKARCKRGYSSYDSRWESFVNFLADMGERPHGQTIDRIDPFKNYCKENCRWADDLTQANNKKETRYLRYDWQIGERFGGAYASAAEWARYLRILTGNKKWTARRLWSELEMFPLNEIVKATSPFGLGREDLDPGIHRELPDTFSGYLEAVYLQAA